jgi:hypothetical protein
VAWLAANVGGYQRFRSSLADPARAQAKVLHRLVRRNAATAFGRLHRLDEVRSTEEFRRRVPLTSYPDYEPFIDRIAAGEEGVLTRSRVSVLEPTGGSTSGEKLIPYTRDLQRGFRRAVAPWICDLYIGRPHLAFGPGYWSISPVARGTARPGCRIRVGFEVDGEYLGGPLRRIVDATLAVPSAVRLIPSIPAFRYVTLLFLLRCSELRIVSVWHPSFLSLLLEALNEHWDDLVQDIDRGTLSPPVPIPREVACVLKPGLRPRPRRARVLGALGPRDLSLIWPRLGLISCWGDGHAALSLEGLRRLFPGVEIQPKGLVATEAFVTLPFAGRTPLAIRSHFFEFLSGGRTYLAHELEPGGVYSVVVTTGGGLYRYRLEDRVEVTGFLARSPCLRFLGKEDHVSDLCGEKLCEAFVGAALAGIFRELRCAPQFAMLAPDLAAGRPGYTLYLDDQSDPPALLGRRLQERLEENPQYRYGAALGQLAPVRIFRIAGDAHAVYLKRCGEMGHRLGNVKPLSLSRHPGWSEIFAGRYLPVGGPPASAPVSAAVARG